MTLTDLVTTLVSGESVVYAFRSPRKTHRVKPRPKATSHTHVTTEQLMAAAEKLQRFTRRDLQERTGCSFRAAKHFLESRRGVWVETVDVVPSNGGPMHVWAWRGQ